MRFLTAMSVLESLSMKYCGGYSGEDPPLPIPNREVKLTIADGTAPPGGRVGSCHFFLNTPEIIMVSGVFCIFLELSICTSALNFISLSFAKFVNDLSFAFAKLPYLKTFRS